MLHPTIIVHVENVVSLTPPPPLAHKKYESVASWFFTLLDRIFVNFYHCFSGVAQVCRDAAGK